MIIAQIQTNRSLTAALQPFYAVQFLGKEDQLLIWQPPELNVADQVLPMLVVAERQYECLAFWWWSRP